MDTDKNAWPYLVALLGIGGGTMISTICVSDTFKLLLLVFALVIGFSQLALFLSIAFSGTLRPISLYKKVIFSLCPVVYFVSSEFRYWMLTELAPEVTYEQFLNRRL
jgi:hypothetical protein